MKQKIYLTKEKGVISPEAHTTLIEACKSLDVSYRMAKLGKRVFKGDRAVLEVKMVRRVMWVIQVGGILLPEVGISIKSALKCIKRYHEAGASSGKLMFGGIVLTEVTVIKNKNLIRKAQIGGFKRK